MATITNAHLAITRDSRKKTARVVVKCKVRFTPLELCMMKACKNHRFFKLRCKLWGADDGFFTGGDDFLYALDKIYYFPDATPSASENCRFEVTVGEGLLDEDFGRDEIYAKLYLYSYMSTSLLTKKTNEVKGWF